MAGNPIIKFIRISGLSKALINILCISSTPPGLQKRMSKSIRLFTSKILPPMPEVNDLDACRVVAFPSLSSSCATRPLIMFFCRQPLSIKADIDIIKL